MYLLLLISATWKCTELLKLGKYVCSMFSKPCCGCSMEVGEHRLDGSGGQSLDRSLSEIFSLNFIAKKGLLTGSSDWSWSGMRALNATQVDKLYSSHSLGVLSSLWKQCSSSPDGRLVKSAEPAPLKKKEVNKHPPSLRI